MGEAISIDVTVDKQMQKAGADALLFTCGVEDSHEMRMHMASVVYLAMINAQIEPYLVKCVCGRPLGAQNRAVIGG